MADYSQTLSSNRLWYCAGIGKVVNTNLNSNYNKYNNNIHIICACIQLALS